MDFSDALRAMKNGKRVKRAVWVDRRADWHGAYAMITEVGGKFDPQITIGYPDSEVLRPFAGSQWDLLADDWEIID